MARVSSGLRGGVSLSFQDEERGESKYSLSMSARVSVKADGSLGTGIARQGLREISAKAALGRAGTMSESGSIFQSPAPRDVDNFMHALLGTCIILSCDFS